MPLSVPVLAAGQEPVRAWAPTTLPIPGLALTSVTSGMSPMMPKPVNGLQPPFVNAPRLIVSVLHVVWLLALPDLWHKIRNEGSA